MKAFLETMVLLIQSLVIIVGILLCIACATLVERKLLGTLQRRRGPVQIGYWGLLQPFADALKLIVKETVIPVKSNPILFVFATILAFTFSMNNYCVIIIVDGPLRDTDLPLLYIMASGSFSALSIILAGWSSNSKYSFLGALRCAAQLIAYELTIGLIILTVGVIVGSVRIGHIVDAQQGLWFVFPYSPLFGLFFITSLAETNRPPFDLPESESELVSGYNTEYSGVGFALFFIAEYGNIILMCALQVLLFFGGWLAPLGLSVLGLPSAFWFCLKTMLLYSLYMFVRAALPRYRYDQLMGMGWKVYLPLALFWYIATVIFVTFF